MISKETILPQINPDYLYRMFLSAYADFYHVRFDPAANNKEAGVFAYTLACYFSDNPKFLKSKILKSLTEPNLKKGLLIIGNFGVGKTTVMSTYSRIFGLARDREIIVQDQDGNLERLEKFRNNFSAHSANALVKEYEGLTSPQERNYFWANYSRGTQFFDDLGTEVMASNYGKLEIFKDLLELRYESRARTFLAMNFYGKSSAETLKFIHDRYGPRVYDRLFAMFNVIELQGKSLRK